MARPSGPERERSTTQVNDLDLTWLMKVRVTDPSSLDGLLDRVAYDAHCASESH